MSIGEKNVILLLADISGYTRFMTAHEKALAHSQIVIKELIESILEQVELPLEGISEPCEDTYTDIGVVHSRLYAPPPPEPFVPEAGAATHYSRIFVDTLRSEVQREYSQVATHPEQGFHFHTGRPLATLLGY